MPSGDDVRAVPNGDELADGHAALLRLMSRARARHEAPPEEPRWLDEAETAAWVAVAAMLLALPAALDAQLRRDAGIGHLEYQVLSWLSMTPDRTARMSVLAEMAAVSQSRVSRIVGRLEHKGLLRRSADPDDRRGTLARLTVAGWDAVVAAAPGHVAEVQRLVLGRLSTAQVGQLEEIARRVLGGVLPDRCIRVPAVPGCATVPSAHPGQALHA